MKPRYMILLLTLSVFLMVGCGQKDTPEKPSGADEHIQKEIEDYTKLTDGELEVYSLDGDVKAQMELACRYDYGTAAKGRDFGQAKVYYEMAAAQGDLDALRCMGYLYLNGCLGEVDLDKAMEYFTQALELGDVDSNVAIGRTYLAGYGDPTSSTASALEYIETAFKQGRPSGAYYMAYLYEEGIGVTQDVNQAMELYTSVLEMKELSRYDAYLVDAARTRIGILYVEGKGIPQDYDKALSNFKMSAKKGYAMAQYYMGQMYENGYGVDKDYETAYDWYVKAAKQDYAPALNQLGYLYYKGNGVDADLDQAIYYHKLAAMQGYAAAQINLGYLYENGIGVDKDLSTALKYYTMAAEQNNEGAKEAVTRVSKQLDEGK